MSNRTLGIAAVVVAALGLSACGDDSSSASSSDLTVQTSFYPLQFVTERVAGDHADVASLTEGGGDPHALELSPRRVGELAESDLVVYLAGFQPAVDEAVDQNAADRALDVGESLTMLGGHDHDHEGHDHEGDDHDHEGEAFDPHVWLDPQNMIAITEAVADRLAETDDTNAEDYRANADALITELTALDDSYSQGLASCTRDLIVVSHEAFGYLTERYDLEQVGVSGLDPEAEPPPQRIAEVQDVINREDVSTIFYERLVSPDVAETIADDLGVETAVLDPIEGLTDETEDETYLTLMEQNLDAIHAANDCS